MAKRRTRKQKEKAKHTFQISWESLNSNSKKSESEANVKWQLTKGSGKPGSENKKLKSSNITVQNTDLASIKKDIVKSLLFTAIILASEMMLYLYLR